LFDKAFLQAHANPCESPLIRTNPHQKGARIRRESACLIICHPLLLARLVTHIWPIVVHCLSLLRITIMDCARHCPQCGLDSERTQNGRLPPWELAKALAFHTVIAAVCDHLGQAAPELWSLNCSPLRGLAAPDRANVARFRDAPLVPGRMPALSSRGGSRGLMMVACTETITIPSSGPGSHPGRAAAGRARFEARGFREEE